MKKLLIVGAGEMQVPVIKKASELGYFCIATDLDPNAPGFKYADKVAEVSTTDYEQTLTIAEQNNIDGIITTSDYPVRTIAYVCEKLGLNGLSVNAAKICTDKFAQREAMAQCGLYVPQNILVSSVAEIEDHKNSFIFPLIVKPIDSSASRGVKKVSTYNELIQAFNYAISYSRQKAIIIEQFIEGPEYSVESLTQNGQTYVIAITEKYTSGSEGNYFVEDQHIIPADLLPQQEPVICEYIKKIIKGFKIDNSATHAELKLTENGPVLIEIAARLGGDFIASDLVPLATGVDMLENVIKIALNETINIASNKSLYSGIRFINSYNYKIAEALIAQKKDFIVRYELKPYKETLITNSFDRLGYIIATATERDDIIKFLNI